MPSNTHPLFQVAVEEGKALFDAKSKAMQEAAHGVPFGKRRLEPAEFRAEQEAGGEQVRRATLERMKKEMGGQRQGIEEYLRQLRKGQ